MLTEEKGIGRTEKRRDKDGREDAEEEGRGGGCPGFQFRDMGKEGRGVGERSGGGEVRCMG